MQNQNSPQGTEEWYAQRLGLVTSSCFQEVLSVGPKGGESIGRAKLKRRLALERISGTREEGFSNRSTRQGHEQEPFARIAYIARTGRNVIESGFIKHKSMLAGASPDGLIGNDGLFEAKRQLREIHIETLLSGEVPSEYVAQVQGQLWVTGRQWCDFVSYNETLDDPLDLVVIRSSRDEEYIQKLEIAVAQFLIEVNEMVNLIQEKAA